MGRKSQKIAVLIKGLRGRGFDPHYLGYFQCFNRQLFYEAHEVLEELWLAERGLAKDAFYKGLIQLAGAFVHVQKRRPQPALALLNLARQNLSRFPGTYDGLELGQVLKLIASWTASLQADPGLCERMLAGSWPILMLESP